MLDTHRNTKRNTNVAVVGEHYVGRKSIAALAAAQLAMATQVPAISSRELTDEQFRQAQERDYTIKLREPKGTKFTINNVYIYALNLKNAIRKFMNGVVAEGNILTEKLALVSYTVDNEVRYTLCNIKKDNTFNRGQAVKQTEEFFAANNKSSKFIRVVIAKINIK